MQVIVLIAQNNFYYVEVITNFVEAKTTNTINEIIIYLSTTAMLVVCSIYFTQRKIKVLYRRPRNHKTNLTVIAGFEPTPHSLAVGLLGTRISAQKH